MKPSRAMITGELAWAWVALSYAWSGSGMWPFDGGFLHAMLDKRNLDELWSVVVGIPAVALMYASAREWWRYRLFTLMQLDFSARVRGHCCLALGFSWAYIFYILLETQARVSSILPIAAGGVVSMLYYWSENRRVRRDIKKQTTTFRAAV